jgi:hypothetical protein
VTVYLDSRCFAFLVRAFAAAFEALIALSRRCAGVMLAARVRPPIRPDLRALRICSCDNRTPFIRPIVLP